jgi:hypothetical protein
VGPLAEGSYGFEATFTSTNNNYTGNTSTCEPFTVHAPPQVAQITPTNTTCQQFASGGSATQFEVEYGVKSGNINQVNPGVFFYWVRVSVSAGSQSFTIQQTQNDTNYFLLGSGSSAFDPHCNTLSTRIETSTQTAITGTQVASSNVEVDFTAPSAGTYFIGIKYSTSNVVGIPPPNAQTTCVEGNDPLAPDPGPVSNCATYNFQTFNVPEETEGVTPEPPILSSATPVPGSFNSIVLEPKVGDTN